ncbi:hypothetical protein M378DRAFT_17707 [Amanita muscaria Koide BX008]|uniref:Uncharacterized protein n=1 Tax=Amanita muscaria (strain Koide BX008) TaxID=946122 RepID=A0A0C2WGE0_AMAMK|nr:hypothetical protein M378DRAFT_17707 [Amanita muscaria Koide BX008]
MDYVRKCIKIVEHGNPLFGIDSPTTIPHNWFVAPPHVVELQGGFYELSPGNAKMSHPDLKRDYFTKECLICGRDHFTNEHESQTILIKKDLQENSLDSRFNPRRTSLFTGPGEPIHVQYYYSDVFYTTEDGQQIVGSRPRRQGTIPHTITTRAVITEEGRVIPSPTIPRQGQSIRSFDLPSRPSTSTWVAAEEIRITRPRGTSVQAQREQQSYPLLYLLESILQDDYQPLRNALNIREECQQFHPHLVHPERLVKQDLHLEEEDQEELEHKDKTTNALAPSDL